MSLLCVCVPDLTWLCGYQSAWQSCIMYVHVYHVITFIGADLDYLGDSGIKCFFWCGSSSGQTWQDLWALMLLTLGGRVLYLHVCAYTHTHTQSPSSECKRANWHVSCVHILHSWPVSDHPWKGQGLHLRLRLWHSHWTAPSLWDLCWRACQWVSTCTSVQRHSCWESKRAFHMYNVCLYIVYL